MDETFFKYFIEYVLVSFSQQGNHFFGLMQVDLAFSWLCQERKRTDPNNENDTLAVAEHYMYSRNLVASGKWDLNFAIIMALGYDSYKVLDTLREDFLVALGNHREYTRPSVFSTTYGIIGAYHGAIDKAAVEVNPSALLPPYYY